MSVVVHTESTEDFNRLYIVVDSLVVVVQVGQTYAHATELFDHLVSHVVRKLGNVFFIRHSNDPSNFTINFAASRPNHGLDVLIVADGYDNYSREATADKVFELVKHIMAILNYGGSVEDFMLVQHLLQRPLDDLASVRPTPSRDHQWDGPAIDLPLPNGPYDKMLHEDYLRTPPIYSETDPWHDGKEQPQHYDIGDTDWAPGTA